MPIRTVLVVDDDPSMCRVLGVILSGAGYEARAALSGDEALRELAQRHYDIVLSDVCMPQMDGMTLVREIRAQLPDQTIIVMSAFGSHDTAIDALKAGAYDYVSKPFRPDELILVLRKAEERERLQRENQGLRSELSRTGRTWELVGQSPAMCELARQVQRVAAVKATVLVTGESGTGKELVARALHSHSPRAAMPFVAVNCGAIPEALMESELFGHVRGAFTDAVRDKKGLFAEADGGTLFLDEIGELPAAVQVKLLRALQESEVRRVGDNRSRKVDVRVVAATARNLDEAVAQGRFREDLFYRLNVVGLRLPPLRERPEDIPDLALHFVAKYNRLLERRPPVRAIASDAMELMKRSSWPGNVRQLENAIERAVVLCEGDELGPRDLPNLAAKPAPAEPLLGHFGLSIKQATRAIEESFIRQALQRTGGNRTRAADLLEISQRSLLYKIKEFGIDAGAGRGESARSDGGKGPVRN